MTNEVKTVESHSEQETYDLGFEMGKKAYPGQVCTLIGDLGVGKTVFTQGFAAGLGVKDYICSPTFTIVQVYDDARLPFYHFDIYRISDIMELYDVGFDDYLSGQGVSVVEWADMAKALLPPDTIRVTIVQENPLEADRRTITVEKPE